MLVDLSPRQGLHSSASASTRSAALASSDIRVLIRQDGNPALYRQRLDELLEGSHVQDATKVKVVEHLFPSELVRLVRDRNLTSLIDKAGITPTAAEKILGTLSCQEDLAALETVELVDQPRIELDDGGTAARLVKQGSVDECRHEIVNLLEGGREAFELRAERYHR